MSKSRSFLALQTFSDDEPFCVYWKDTNGRYLGINNYSAQFLVRSNYNPAVIGRSDEDIFPHTASTQYIENDSIVIANRKKQSYLETFPAHGRNKYIQLSMKTPLIEHNNDVVGVLGVTYQLNNYFIRNNEVFLSQRQVDTLACLLAGMTAKMAARVLGIGPKAVESHIEAIKNKFGCSTRSEIISVVYANGAARSLEHYLHFYRAQSSNSDYLT